MHVCFYGAQPRHRGPSRVAVVHQASGVARVLHEEPTQEAAAASQDRSSGTGSARSNGRGGTAPTTGRAEMGVQCVCVCEQLQHISNIDLAS